MTGTARAVAAAYSPSGDGSVTATVWLSGRINCSRAWERLTTPVATPSLSPGRPPGWSERREGVAVPVRLCSVDRRRVVIYAASRAVDVATCCKRCVIHDDDDWTTQQTAATSRASAARGRTSFPFMAVLLSHLPCLCFYSPLLCASGAALYYAVVSLLLRPRCLSYRTQLHSKDFCTAAVPTSPVRVIKGREDKGRPWRRHRRVRHTNDESNDQTTVGGRPASGHKWTTNCRPLGRPTRHCNIQ